MVSFFSFFFFLFYFSSLWSRSSAKRQQTARPWLHRARECSEKQEKERKSPESKQGGRNEGICALLDLQRKNLLMRQGLCVNPSYFSRSTPHLRKTSVVTWGPRRWGIDFISVCLDPAGPIPPRGHTPPKCIRILFGLYDGPLPRHPTLCWVCVTYSSSKMLFFFLLSCSFLFSLVV